MYQMLKPGQTVFLRRAGTAATIEQMLGSGGQGEVYRSVIGKRPVAVKWYLPSYLQTDPRLRERLETAVRTGPPNARFLWPEDLVVADEISGFGYMMPLREPRFKGIVDMMRRRVEPTFAALATAGFELADSFLQLHSKGMCYRDISFGNVFLDPQTGEVRICDNDNVDVDGKKGGIGGTIDFMAPEIVRGDAEPSSDTDLHSLAVLLFYLLIMHHPLNGKKEYGIRCLDYPAKRKLYGTDPVFIFDPTNDNNRPVAKDPVSNNQQNALDFWPLYPRFIQELFIRAFTRGLRDPRNGRVRESEWRMAMVQLRDSIGYCSNCPGGMEAFFDFSVDAPPRYCWACKKQLQQTACLHLGPIRVMLNYNTRLYPYHTMDSTQYDFSKTTAEITQHPQHPNIWGLKNRSEIIWRVTMPDGVKKDVPPSKSVKLDLGVKINFGSVEGEICALGNKPK